MLKSKSQTLGQEFDRVSHRDIQALFYKAVPDLHYTSRAAGCHNLCSCFFYGRYFFVEDVHAGVVVVKRKGAASSAAVIRAGHFPETGTNPVQKLARPGCYPLCFGQMAGVVIGHAPVNLWQVMSGEEVVKQA